MVFYNRNSGTLKVVVCVGAIIINHLLNMKILAAHIHLKLMRHKKVIASHGLPNICACRIAELVSNKGRTYLWVHVCEKSVASRNNWMNPLVLFSRYCRFGFWPPIQHRRSAPALVLLHFPDSNTDMTASRSHCQMPGHNQGIRYVSYSIPVSRHINNVANAGIFSVSHRPGTDFENRRPKLCWLVGNQLVWHLSPPRVRILSCWPAILKEIGLLRGSR